MKKIILIVLLSFISIYQGFAQKSAADTSTSTLKVGIKSSPPFTMINKQGYSGISIDLWEEIAEKKNFQYEIKEYELIPLLNAVENGEVDVCISPLTVTSERVKRFHFTQPFYISNLAIAVPGTGETSALQFIANFFSLEFIKAVFLLFTILLVFGLLIWIAERRKNTGEFPENWRGIGDGIWWSAVTMTTVGYGDKSPKSFPGRLISIIWMFTAVIVISSFTAAIASALTVDKISSNIEDVKDLRQVKTGTVKASSSDKYLQKKNINTIQFETIREGLQALADKKIDAFVYDEPILRYLIRDMGLSGQVYLLPESFNKSYYSFSLPPNSLLRDSINPVLLEELERPTWQGILNEYNLQN